MQPSGFFSDDLLQIKHCLWLVVPFHNFMVVALAELAQPRDQTGCPLERDDPVPVLPVVIDVQPLLQSEQIVFSQDGVAMPEPVAQGRRHSWLSVTLFLLRQHLMRFGHQWRKAHPEDLPVRLQFQPDRCKPCVHVCQQLPQLSLVGAEDSEVVHLP